MAGESRKKTVAAAGHGTALLPPSESEAVSALGSRTTMLHPELKRHRAWWREILKVEVPKKLAECAAPQAVSDASVPVSAKVNFAYTSAWSVFRPAGWQLTLPEELARTFVWSPEEGTELLISFFVRSL